MAQSSSQLRSRHFCFLSIIMVLISADLCLARNQIRGLPWDPKVETTNLMKYLRASKKFGAVADLLNKTGPANKITGVQALQSYLSGGSITLFFPLDTAYNSLSATTKGKLQSDFSWLTLVLQFQVVQTKLTYAQLKLLKRRTTMITKCRAQLLQKMSDGGIIILNPVNTAALSNLTLKDAYQTTALSVHGIDTFLFPKI